MMTIQQLRQCKLDTGLTYAEISQRSGVPIPTVQRVFSGSTRAPRRRTLQALEKVFLEEGRAESPMGKTAAGCPAGIPSVNTPVPEITQDVPAARYSPKSPVASDRAPYSIVGESAPVYGENAAAVSTPDTPGQYSGVLSSTVHQIIVAQLFLQFEEAITQHGSTCQVFFAPIGVLFPDEQGAILQPDLCLVCDENKIQKDMIHGAPDLVVEVLSPATRRKDMTLKMWQYSDGGVREYWLVDPDAQSVIVYDFEHAFHLSTCSFHDTIPVGISDGTASIDFNRIWQKIQRFY